MVEIKYLNELNSVIMQCDALIIFRAWDSLLESLSNDPISNNSGEFSLLPGESGFIPMPMMQTQGKAAIKEKSIHGPLKNERINESPGGKYNHFSGNNLFACRNDISTVENEIFFVSNTIFTSANEIAPVQITCAPVHMTFAPVHMTFALVQMKFSPVHMTFAPLYRWAVISTARRRRECGHRYKFMEVSNDYHKQ